MHEAGLGGKPRLDWPWTEQQQRRARQKAAGGLQSRERAQLETRRKGLRVVDLAGVAAATGLVCLAVAAPSARLVGGPTKTEPPGTVDSTEPLADCSVAFGPAATRAVPQRPVEGSPLLLVKRLLN